MRKILIVDDNETNLKIHSDILRLSGYDVCTVQNGDDVLSAVEDEQPDLILMDVLLPGRNGLEITRQLKQEPDTQHIPIIGLSAKATQEDKEAFIQSGGIDYLAKPFTIEDLLKTVESALVGHPGSPV
jgi:CheY-like chemotaxis protein